MIKLIFVLFLAVGLSGCTQSMEEYDIPKCIPGYIKHFEYQYTWDVGNLEDVVDEMIMKGWSNITITAKRVIKADCV